MRTTSLVLSSLLACGLAAQQQVPPPPPPDGDLPRVLGVESAEDPELAAPAENYKDPKPNAWFEKTQGHLGTYFQEESANGKFKFRKFR